MALIEKDLFSGYHNKEKLPLGSYAVLDGVYTSWLAGSLIWMLKRGKKLPDQIPLADILLLGIATHKLSLVITKEWSTAPLRAPFTRFRRIEKGGELDEESRGSGIQEAIGDLLTCPYCSGVWLATGLMLGYAARPNVTRLIAGVYTSVTISDFLHTCYGKAQVMGTEDKTAA